MITTGKTRLRAVFIGTLLGLGACVADAMAFESPQDGVYTDRIDWGMTADMSGPASAAQAPWGHGFQTAIKAINEKGGVNGRKINVLTEDTRYDATVERVAYDKFVSQTPTLGTSGMGNSSAQTALVPLIKRNKLPVIGTYTTAKVAIDPPTPYFYGGFCGFKEMAQVGIGCGFGQGIFQLCRGGGNGARRDGKVDPDQGGGR